MFGDQAIDYATFGPQVLALAREVLDEFSASRGREGEKLALMIVDRVNAIRDIVRRMREDLWPAIEAGELRIPIDRTFPLEQAAEAQAHMKANAHFGKIVLTT